MAEMPVEQRLRDFLYHQVDAKTAAKMAAIREAYYRLATLLCLELPDSLERSLALTHLEESSMRAIQCLAVSEGTPLPIGKVVV